MNRSNKTRIPAILVFFCLLMAFYSFPAPVAAQASSAGQVLAEINAYRAANGLDPLSENQYLNIAAQNHANWIAAGNPGGHTGAGGSSAQDRAVAVGYGGGSGVSVTEIWARDRGSANHVLYNFWANSGPHSGVMLSTWHNEFGAGVAVDGSGLTVYVVKVGHVTGTVIRPTRDPSIPTRTPGPIINPVTQAEPNPDGSVIHVVQSGQRLWWIAEAYEIEMAELLELNNLTENSTIFPGDELIIVPAREVIEEEDQEDLPEPTPTLTRTPMPTATRTLQPTPQAPTPTPTQLPRLQANFLVNIFSGDSLGVGIGLVAVSVFGIGLLLFTTSRLK